MINRRQLHPIIMADRNTQFLSACCHRLLCWSSLRALGLLIFLLAIMQIGILTFPVLSTSNISNLSSLASYRENQLLSRKESISYERKEEVETNDNGAISSRTASNNANSSQIDNNAISDQYGDVNRSEKNISASINTNMSASIDTTSSSDFNYAKATPFYAADNFSSINYSIPQSSGSNLSDIRFIADYIRSIRDVKNNENVSFLSLTPPRLPVVPPSPFYPVIQTAETAASIYPPLTFIPPPSFTYPSFPSHDSRVTHSLFEMALGFVPHNDSSAMYGVYKYLESIRDSCFPIKDTILDFLDPASAHYLYKEQSNQHTRNSKFHDIVLPLNLVSPHTEGSYFYLGSPGILNPKDPFPKIMDLNFRRWIEGLQDSDPVPRIREDDFSDGAKEVTFINEATAKKEMIDDDDDSSSFSSNEFNNSISSSSFRVSSLRNDEEKKQMVSRPYFSNKRSCIDCLEEIKSIDERIQFANKLYDEQQRLYELISLESRKEMDGSKLQESLHSPLSLIPRVAIYTTWKSDDVRAVRQSFLPWIWYHLSIGVTRFYVMLDIPWQSSSPFPESNANINGSKAQRDMEVQIDHRNDSNISGTSVFNVKSTTIFSSKPKNNFKEVFDLLSRIHAVRILSARQIHNILEQFDDEDCLGQDWDYIPSLLASRKRCPHGDINKDNNTSCTTAGSGFPQPFLTLSEQVMLSRSRLMHLQICGCTTALRLATSNNGDDLFLSSPPFPSIFPSSASSSSTSSSSIFPSSSFASPSRFVFRHPTHEMSRRFAAAAAAGDGLSALAAAKEEEAMDWVVHIDVDEMLAPLSSHRNESNDNHDRIAAQLDDVMTREDSDIKNRRTNHIIQSNLFFQQPTSRFEALSSASLSFPRYLSALVSKEPSKKNEGGREGEGEEDGSAISTVLFYNQEAFPEHPYILNPYEEVSLFRTNPSLTNPSARTLRSRMVFGSTRGFMKLYVNGKSAVHLRRHGRDVQVPGPHGFAKRKPLVQGLMSARNKDGEKGQVGNGQVGGRSKSADHILKPGLNSEMRFKEDKVWIQRQSKEWVVLHYAFASMNSLKERHWCAEMDGREEELVEGREEMKDVEREETDLEKQKGKRSLENNSLSLPFSPPSPSLSPSPSSSSSSFSLSPSSPSPPQDLPPSLLPSLLPSPTPLSLFTQALKRGGHRAADAQIDMDLDRKICAWTRFGSDLKRLLRRPSYHGPLRPDSSFRTHHVSLLPSLSSPPPPISPPISPPPISSPSPPLTSFYLSNQVLMNGSFVLLRVDESQWQLQEKDDERGALRGGGEGEGRKYPRRGGGFESNTQSEGKGNHNGHNPNYDLDVVCEVRDVDRLRDLLESSSIRLLVRVHTPQMNLRRLEEMFQRERKMDGSSDFHRGIIRNDSSNDDDDNNTGNTITINTDHTTTTMHNAGNRDNRPVDGAS